MKKILPEIEDWFLTRKEYLDIFSKCDTRVEGWFKGELLVLFERLKQRGKLDKFKLEVNVTSPKDNKRKQVDLCIYMEGKKHFCELKAVCISQAEGTPRNLQFYFRDDHVGIIKDMKKLDGLKVPNKWVLAFIYPTPRSLNWKTTIASLPKSLAHWNPVTDPAECPDFLFISLWKG